MKKQKKLLLILPVVLFFFFFGAHLAIATTPVEALKNNINAAFNWGFLIIGSLALLSFLYGALRYMTSAGGAGTGEGKDRMIGSLLGIILIVSSWLLTKTINPQLINLDLTPLPPGAGIFLVGSSSLPKAVMPLEVPDISSTFKQGYKNISYECVKGSESELPNLLIWYYKTNGTAQTFRIRCGQKHPISSSGGYVLGFETNGVYLFSNGDCSTEGAMSNAFTTSQSPLPENWQGRVKSVRIVAYFGKYDPAMGIGILFHQSRIVRDGGECQTGIYDALMLEKCVKWNEIGFPAYSLDIFTIPRDTKLAGKGVTFFAKNSGELQTQQSGFFNVTQDDLAKYENTHNEVWNMKASDIRFSYVNVAQPAGENCPADPNNTSTPPASLNCPCPNFEKCHKGSIQVKGDYLVVLFSKRQANNPSGSAGSSAFCQSFIRDVENLGTESFIKPGNEFIFDRAVIQPIIP